MKKIPAAALLLFTFFLCIGRLAAQNNGIVAGKVVFDKDDSPIPGASVALRLKGDRFARGFITDNEGNFRFTVPANTSGRLEVSSPGFEKKVITIANTNIKSILIRLKTVSLIEPGPQVFVDPLRHIPVEVRAVRTVDNAPFTKTDLKKNDLEKNNLGQDLPFLLNQTPSVLAFSDAGNGVGYTGLRIRGTDAARINMTINGIPYNDAESQGIFFVDLPDFASSVSSLQIQRGVGSSSNGAGSFGATLSFSTRETPGKPTVELNNSFGSFNTRKHTFKAATGLLNHGFYFDTRLSAIRSNGYIERAKSKLDAFTVTGGFQGKRTSLRFNLISGTENTYQAWNGVPESLLATNRRYNSAGTEKPGEPYNNETDNYKQTHYQFHADHRISARVLLNTSAFLTRGRGYYEQYKAQRKFSDYGLANPVINGLPVTRTDLVRQLWLDNDYYGQIFGFQLNTGRTFFIAGGGWSHYKGRHFGEIIWAQYAIPKNYRWYELDAAKTDVNGFAKWQRYLNGGINLFADLQYRNVFYELNGFRDNPALRIRQQYHFLNPKAGIAYEGKKIFLSASYAQANKEPNRDDFEAGASELPRAETLHDVELNLRKTVAKYLQLQFTAYYMYYRNQLVLTGKINDVGAYTRTNIPNSFRSGIETQLSGTVNTWFNYNANLTLSRNKIKSFTEYIDDYDNGGQKTTLHNNSDIAFSPSVIAGLTTTFKPVKAVELALQHKYAGKQYLDNTRNAGRQLNAYYVADVLLSYQPPVKQLSRLRFQLQVNNLFNKKYEANGYTFSYFYGGTTTTENYYYPMAGTNFMAGVSLKW